MTHVRTSPYYPQSNGKLERYHRTIKSECIRPGTPLCLEDARRLVFKYVDQYNNVRLHSALGYITPADKLYGREKEIFDERDRKLQEAREKRARNRRRQNEDDLCPTQANGCYTEDAWAEDRATVGTDPSADPGPEAKSGVVAHTAPPHFLSTAISLLAQSDKPNPEKTAFRGGR